MGNLTSSRANPQPSEQAKEYGVKVLVEGESPVVDIIAIHGLDGHRILTWTAETQAGKKMWLEDSDMLKKDVRNARILTYGYNAATSGKPEDLDRKTMHDHAEQLITKVVQFREITDTPKNRPIIFIAYSMGGIILKFALIYANGHNEQHLHQNKSFTEATAGILFIGTPHQGTDGVTVAESLVKIYAGDKVNRILTKDLVAHSEMLQDQLQAYRAISHKFTTKFFYECYPTVMPGGHTQVFVPKYSAVVPGAVNAEPIGLNKNHFNLVKFNSRDDDDYTSVATAIVLMIRDLPNDPRNIC